LFTAFLVHSGKQRFLSPFNDNICFWHNSAKFSRGGFLCSPLSKITWFEQTLEDAYAALAKIETELDELRETLEYHHARLGGAFE